jgi:hypothetical protein
MVTADQVKEIVSSLEGTDEHPHFERTAFRVKKKIFATISLKDKTLNVRFTPQLQMIYCPPQSEVIFPILNGWGKNGWTTINLNKANKKLVEEALKEAYELRKAK